MDVQTLETDAGPLRYAVEGEGPLLFLVGAPVGIAGFAPLAAALATRFTVVRHDPRGVGGSPADPAARVTPDVRAEDLLSLVQALGGEPALIFGASGGAVTGLELLTAHPSAAHRLIAHEPPLFSLLPDGEALLARADAAFRLAADDPDAGMQAFADLTGVFQMRVAGDPPPPPVRLPPSSPEEREKNRFALHRMAPGTVHYRPDLAALDPTRLRIAAGRASHGQPARRASEALARLLQTDLVEAPGNHLGLALAAGTFAAWLTQMLQDELTAGA